MKLTCTETGLVRVHQVISEAGERNDRLDRRAGRIDAAHRTVEQRGVYVIFERAVLGSRDAAAEHVGVESWPAGHCNDIAVVRVDRYEGPTSTSQGILGGALHLQIHRKNDVVARSRRMRVQRRDERALFVYRSALGVDQ